MSRNRRTGASKHYAFLKFESEDVADIVQRTMDKYLLFGHILAVKRVPKERVHPDMMRDSGKKFKKIPWGKIEARGLAVPRSREVWDRRVKREEERREKLRKVCEDYGYEMEIKGPRKTEEVFSKREAVQGGQKELEGGEGKKRKVVGGELGPVKRTRSKGKTEVVVG